MFSGRASVPSAEPVEVVNEYVCVCVALTAEVVPE